MDQLDAKVRAILKDALIHPDLTAAEAIAIGKGIDSDATTLGDQTSDSLGMDSLDLVELELTVEEEFSIQLPDELWRLGSTVGEVIADVRRLKGGA